MIPREASRGDHEELRDWVKPFLLGIHYGLTVIGAAARLNVSLEQAARYLEMHQRLFPTYWKWSTDYVDLACERRVMQSRWGWRLQIPGGEDRVSKRDIKRSLKNHPIQTMGSHILHFTEIGLTESGIRVCCPIHDAVLWESTLEQVDADAIKVEQIMRTAAKAALGIEIPVDHKIVRHALDADARYMDKRGRRMFEKATTALKIIETATSVRGDIGQVLKKEILNVIPREYPESPPVDVPHLYPPGRSRAAPRKSSSLTCEVARDDRAASDRRPVQR
jgi:hypothetical protein